MTATEVEGTAQANQVLLMGQKNFVLQSITLMSRRLALGMEEVQVEINREMKPRKRCLASAILKRYELHVPFLRLLTFHL